MSKTSFTRARNVTLISDTAPKYKLQVRSTKWSSNPSMKHHSQTHIIKTTVMKQSKGLNGVLKPENKKSTKKDHDGPDYRH